MTIRARLLKVQSAARQHKGLVCCCCKCRKASGAKFASNGNVARIHFELVEGQSRPREFEPSTGQHRVFSGRRGSPRSKRNEATPEHVLLRLDDLDTLPGA